MKDEWEKMNNYEMKENPEQGENIQYVAIHAIKFNRIIKALELKDDGEIVSFWIRESAKL